MIANRFSTLLLATAAGLAVSCASTRSAEAPAAAHVVLDISAAPGVDAPSLSFVSALTGTSRSSRTWWRSLVWVLTGTGEEEDGDRARLVRPFDVVAEADGGAVVADPDLPAVIRFARDGKALSEVSCRTQPWESPISLARGQDGTLYVADAAAGRVVRIRPDGCDAIPLPEGTRPTGLAAVRERLFVADPPGHRVLILGTDGTSVATVGERGSGEGHFSFPTDVAAAADGTVFVVDALNFRIVHLAHDGRWLGAFGGPGESGPGLARPKGIHVCEDGRILVSDAQRDVILAFRGDGTFLYSLGATGSDPGRFAHPSGISTRGGRLFVADSQNRRVQVFDSRGESR